MGHGIEARLAEVGVIATDVQDRVQTLEERLTRGADVLCDLEQRGEMGSLYQLWLQRWTDLLREYEALQLP